MFRTSMLDARASKGGKFRETARSRVSEIQLAFARLYGVFDEATSDRLLGGFSIHCFDEFSQSFPIPDLSHLPPSTVYEGGQLWAKSHEPALALRKGAMILLGLLRAHAFLIYPLIIPRDVSTLYRVFKRVGPPFALPFAQTLTGEKVFMQAMLLDGDQLQRQVDLASRDGFETRRGHSVIKFGAPISESDTLVDRSRRTEVTDGSEALVGAFGAGYPEDQCIDIDTDLTVDALLSKSSRFVIPLGDTAQKPVFRPSTVQQSAANGIAGQPKPSGRARS